MIDSRNEFETIPAFDVIAGSSMGGWSTRDFCASLIHAIETVSDRQCQETWKELARYSDIDDTDELGGLLEELIDDWNDCANMPDYCNLVFHDNELIVMPDVDSMLEETPSVNHIPDEFYQPDGIAHYTLAHVNDHGNVDYLVWNDAKREYEIAWSVV